MGTKPPTPSLTMPLNLCKNSPICRHWISKEHYSFPLTFFLYQNDPHPVRRKSALQSHERDPKIIDLFRNMRNQLTLEERGRYFKRVDSRVNVFYQRSEFTKPLQGVPY